MGSHLKKVTNVRIGFSGGTCAYNSSSNRNTLLAAAIYPGLVSNFAGGCVRYLDNMYFPHAHRCTGPSLFDLKDRFGIWGLYPTLSLAVTYVLHQIRWSE